MKLALPISLVAAFGLAASAATLAQGGGSWPALPSGHRIANTLDLEDLGLPSSVDIERLEWGNYSGDFSGEMVSLIDGKLHFSRIPYIFASLEEVSPAAPTANDVTTITDSANVKADRLIVAEATRLAVYDWNTTSSSFGAPTALNTVDYAGVTRLKTVDLAQDGYTDILALDADGKTVRGATIVGNTLTEVAAVTLPVAPADFTFVPWGASGQDAIAAVFPGLGLYVYSFSGTLLKRYTNTSFVGGVEMFSTFASGVGREHRLFWWYQNTATGNHEITVADAGGLETPFELNVPPAPGMVAKQLAPVSIVVGDHDLDSQEDVLVVTDHHTTILLMNQHDTSSTQHFGVGLYEYFTIPTSNSAGSTQQQPYQATFADLDFGGAESLVIADDEDDILYFVHQHEPPSGASQGAVLSSWTAADFVDDHTCHKYNPSFPGPESSNFNLAMAIPPAVVNVKNYNYLQVQLYHQDGTSGNFSYLDSEARMNEAYPLVSTTDLFQWKRIPLTYDNGGSPMVPVGEFWDTNNRRNFWTLFRFVEVDTSTSQVESTSQFFSLAMTLKDEDNAWPGWPYEDYLTGLPGAGAPLDMVQSDDPSEQIPGGNSHAGIHVSHSIPPSFPPNDPPVPGNLVITSFETQRFTPWKQ